MQASVRLILRLVRTSDIPGDEVAVGGFYQKALDSSAPSQMVRIFLPIESEFFPEISGGKHRFSIRFMQQSDPNQRASQTTEDIPFQLACCII
jgi:cell division protein ZapD